ncbi:hypothetical protein [Flavobacterium branchiicola]|uniref:Uncharacterized protein n=1 Tax=Flavobacterium branchiicola TaxID=1114875 RepID=A0ABV9PE54_9FLAO|nr:hypothetical protein [Flavobacterium branchiicola]MBS7253291.1 hypothetical protein [Flavobacterium branchiicola]
MDLHFEDFGLTIKAADLEVPYHLMDEPLFLTVRSHLTGLLSDQKTEIFYFGMAPDNTADRHNELLENGVFTALSGSRRI